jgi:hypothetical protein
MEEVTAKAMGRYSPGLAFGAAISWQLVLLYRKHCGENGKNKSVTNIIGH